MEAEAWRHEVAQRASVGAAWLNAALQRAKRLPPLENLLGKSKPRRITRDQAKAEWAYFRDRFQETKTK